MQDIRGSSHVYNNLGHPIGTFLCAISTTHCMTVSLAQGGDGLGTMWGKKKHGSTCRKLASAPLKPISSPTTFRTTGMWSGNRSNPRDAHLVDSGDLLVAVPVRQTDIIAVLTRIIHEQVRA